MTWHSASPILLLAGSVILGCGGIAHAEEATVFSHAKAVSDESLADIRGGFVLSDGSILSISYAAFQSMGGAEGGSAGLAPLTGDLALLKDSAWHRARGMDARSLALLGPLVTTLKDGTAIDRVTEIYIDVFPAGGLIGPRPDAALSSYVRSVTDL